ncbi:hypothetical protein ACFWPQ_01950 [Streptomyces sp. NPDC058464]|uniref:hypothetical protein n=1 Tax=Streptomyces sp. NPDC058464 TaxID=3346511 RepID=UPI0036470DDF
MTDKIRAPWTPEQVAALNEFQQGGWMHPFTCGYEHPAHPNAVLKATTNGWRCYVIDCDWEQDWAHAFMADRSAWPKQCSCGGRFPVRHLHADVHEPADEPARTTPNNPAASAHAARSQALATAIGSTLHRHGHQLPEPVLHAVADTVIRHYAVEAWRDEQDMPGPAAAEEPKERCDCPPTNAGLELCPECPGRQTEPAGG